MDKQQGVEDRPKNNDLLKTIGDISFTATIFILIGVTIGIFVGIVRGSWVDVLIFSSSLGSLFAALGLVIGVIENAFFRRKQES